MLRRKEWVREKKVEKMVLFLFFFFSPLRLFVFLLVMIAIVIPLSNKYPLLPPSRFSVG